MNEPVVVGYDDSDESTAAVQWAAKVAARRGARLTVVAATGWDEPPKDLAESDFAAFVDQMIGKTAERGARIAKETAEVRVEAVGVRGGAAKALKEHAAGAQLLVIGHRGRGQLRGALLGSVAYAIATHAPCPVAVVRGVDNELPDESRPIVVATDGSEKSLAALTKAAGWAAEIGVPLQIVVAWQAPYFMAYGDAMAAADFEEDNREHREAAAISRRAVETVREAHPDLEVTTSVLSGRPAEVIVEVARDASLIVMGARGRGDFASLLLGSVSREVMERAACPVYIVR